MKVTTDPKEIIQTFSSFREHVDRNTQPHIY